MTNKLLIEVCFALAGLVSLFGALEVYIHMNDDDTDELKRTVLKVLVLITILVVTAQFLML